MNYTKTVSALALSGLLLASALIPNAAFAASLSVDSISPGTTVTPGNQVSFHLTGSGYGSALTYTVTDSFSGSSVTNSNIIQNSGVFVWTPVDADSGVHNLTITATDQANTTAYAYQQITVQGPPTVSVQSISPGTSVAVGQTLSFTAQSTSFTSPVYAIIDNFSGTSITPSKINSSSGAFSWVPLQQDVGTHQVTVYANDSLGHNASSILNVTVLPSASLAVQSITPGTSVSAGQTVSFMLVPTGFSNPTYTLNDTFTGSTLNNNSINQSTGVVTWTPLSVDSGTHQLTLYASDSTGKTANTTLTLSVNQAGALTLTNAMPGSVVTPGTLVTFQAVTTGFTSPTYTVQDSLVGSSLGNGSISSTGYVNWTPGVNDAGIHVITVRANDLYNHSAVAAATVTVTGTPVVIPPPIVPPPTTSTYKFYVGLSVGSRGADVTALQTRLTAEGVYTGPITGYFGVLTQAGVRAYQAKYGIDQVGSVGPITRARLNL